MRKEHVRSVIHLASSEARINAFVVISCLEGLLSVTMGGMGPAQEGIDSNVLDAPANNDINKGNGRRDASGTNSSEGFTFAACRGAKGGRQGTDAPFSTKADSVTTIEALQCASVSDTSATIVVENSNSSCSNGKKESGAALCVRLGALPAVLACLNEHAGHKQIEPLAARLLSMFACDRTTSGAVRGNTAVAAACTSRMSPVPFALVAGDASGVGLGSEASEPSSVALKTTRGEGETPTSAGSGRRRGHTDDDQSLERFVPCEETSRKHAASTAAVTAISKPTTTTLSSQPSFESPAASAKEGTPPFSRGQLPSNIPSTLRLPATNLVFVLSVVVQESPECQRFVIKGGGIAAMLKTLRQQTSGVDEEASTRGGGARICNGDIGGGARLAEVCLRVMEGIGQPERGRRRLIREGSVETALAVIEQFRWASFTDRL